jgi:hypothetical protein
MYYLPKFPTFKDLVSMYYTPFIRTYDREFPSSICLSSMLFVQVFGIGDKENRRWIPGLTREFWHTMQAIPAGIAWKFS